MIEVVFDAAVDLRLLALLRVLFDHFLNSSVPEFGHVGALMYGLIKMLNSSLGRRASIRQRASVVRLRPAAVLERLRQGRGRVLWRGRGLRTRCLLRFPVYLATFHILIEHVSRLDISERLG